MAVIERHEGYIAEYFGLALHTTGAWRGRKQAVGVRRDCVRLVPDLELNSREKIHSKKAPSGLECEAGSALNQSTLGLIADISSLAEYILLEFLNL